MGQLNRSTAEINADLALARSAVQPGDDVSSLAETTTAKILTGDERTKLSGIETGATADQTAQEIATLIDADTTAETTLKSALGLGTAAYMASSAFDAAGAATSAMSTHEGTYAHADIATALQPNDDAAGLGSGSATDGQVLTADGAGGAAWETVVAGSSLTLNGVSYSDLAAGSNVSIVADGDGTATINVSSGTATLGDGDYGDVSVSGSGTVMTVDAVGQSVVTAHQAALSITESQISDFGSYLTAADVGTNIQAYDADTAKLDVAQSWSAAQTFSAVTLSGAFDGDGNEVARNTTRVVSSVSGTLTIGDHSGCLLVTSGNVTVPTTAGFHAVIVAGGAHTVSFDSTTSAAMAAGDIMTVFVQSSTVIHAVLTPTADKVAFS